jgi:hypothetical protein
MYTSLRDTLMVQGLKLRRLTESLQEAKMDDPAEAVQGLIATLNEQQTRCIILRHSFLSYNTYTLFPILVCLHLDSVINIK